MKRRNFLQKNNSYTNLKKPLKLYRYQSSLLLLKYLWLHKFYFINLFYFYKFIFIFYRSQLANLFTFVKCSLSMYISIFKFATNKQNNHLRVLTFAQFDVYFTYKRLIYNNFTLLDKRFQYYIYPTYNSVIPDIINTYTLGKNSLVIDNFFCDLAFCTSTIYYLIKQYYIYFIYTTIYVSHLNIFVFNYI